MKLVDCHTHTALSQHGQGSVAEVVQAAAEKGLATIALTEHYPLPDGADPTNDSAMLASKLPEYCTCLEEARAQHPELSVVYGVELDYLGDNDPRNITDEVLSFFDYRLLSVHFIDGWAFDNNPAFEEWEKRGVDGLWKRYRELWIDAACSSIPAHTMAHPDLIKKYGYLPGFTLEGFFDCMADAAQAHGRMIEVNTAGLRCGCAEPYPMLDALKAFCHAGVACCVGSDAHKPELVGKDIELAYGLMYEAGYRKVTVPCPGGDFYDVCL